MIKININEKFYTKESINNSIEAFKEITKITLTDSTLTFEDIDKEVDQSTLPYEFMNYVLSEMVNGE